MNFNKSHVSRNLFPLDENKLYVGRIENDGTIDYEIGTITVGVNSVTYEANTTWRGFYTDFIQVNENEKLTFSPNDSSTISWACCCYDENDSFLGKASSQSTAATRTFTLLTGTKKVRMSVTSSNTTYTILQPMLNEGSTALPYEPYSSEVWHDIPHYIHKTDTDTITTLPAEIYPNDTTATVGLKGQTVQNGTPSPDNPIIPQGCGEMTGNLLPEFYAASGEISGNSYTITKNSIETHNDGSVLGAYYVLAEFKRYGNYANYTPIDEKHSFKIPAGTYTFSGNENIYNRDNGLRLIVGQLGQMVSGASAGAINVGVGQTFTVNVDSYVCPVLEIRYDSHVDEYILTNPMLNTGSTALSYEPFGIKIPISSASTTTPVYLGEVESTRKIKKLVLTGEETTWVINSTLANSNAYYRTVSGYYRYSGFCTHYATVDSAQATEGIFFGNNINFLTALSDNIDTVDKWKNYLRQQYAAGTPVTVWYVLATPETAVVNEPIRKIGDYADEVSGITIPVTAGGDTLSVDTTVQPSEVSANYKGWHPVLNVHEKSRNLFDKSTAAAGYGVDDNSGNLFRSAALSASDYINISGESYVRATYITSGVANQYGAFYDENKTYISGYSDYSNAIAVPQNAVYTRITARTEYIDEFMLNAGSSALPYEPYWT